MNTWQDSSEAFAALFRNSPYGIAAIGRSGAFLACNAAFAKIMGLPADRIVGSKAHQIDGTAFGAFAVEALDAAYLGHTLSRDTQIRRADGTWICCEITSVPVTGDAEVRAFFTFQDVTLRNDANFRLLFENDPTVVVAIDTENRITDVNPAGMRLSGYSREEIVGRDVTEFVPPAQRDSLRVALARALGGETVSFAVDAYAADGHVIQYEATGLPIVAQERVAGVYGLLENVTDRMRAERTVAAQREELIDLENDFRSLFQYNPDGAMLFSAQGELLNLNPAAETMAARSGSDMIGRNLRDLVDAPTFQRISKFFQRAVDGETVRYEVLTARFDGSELAANVTLFPKYAQGVVVAVYCMMQDATEQYTSHRKLEQQSQRIRDLYLLATGPDTEAQVMTALQTGCRLLAMEGGAIVSGGNTPSVEMRYDTLEPLTDDAADLAQIAITIVQTREASAGRNEDGDNACACWIGSRLVLGGVPHGALIFFSRSHRPADFEETDLDTVALMSALVASILERRQTRGRLRTLAYYDSLTGLPNRAYFHERVRDALASESPGSLAVMYFDLDRFKDINDTLGHAMGDRFLQIVAHRLKRAVREDAVVARMGGDEFAVLLSDPQTPERTRELAAELLLEIEKPYRLEDFEQFITASIGISVYPSDGRDDQTLIKNADIAMYEAKDRGGNRYYLYDRALEAPIHTRLAQEKLLRRAIDRGEFTLHFQPIVDVSTEQTSGIEALVRWKDPDRGLIFPDEFIPTAEASGLIVPLGEWIAETAARTVRGWHDRGLQLMLAINISARQFHQNDLCDRLETLLAAAGLSPEYVEVEITESMAMSDIPHAIDTVRRLKSLGAHIGVDDFGTGHSSLNYLRRFEIDHLKIDRSFIAGVGREPSDETIVRAMIAMGHSLGLTIVAEGVETAQQLQLLRHYGCDRAQGYLFSRPLDSSSLEAFVQASRGTGPGADKDLS